MKTFTKRFRGNVMDATGKGMTIRRCLACGMGARWSPFGQTSGMASKYDAYWGGQLHRIRAELEIAATGVPAVVSVPDLARLGVRQSWYGIAEVRGQELTYSSKAHATSLGTQIAASGISIQPDHRLREMLIYRLPHKNFKTQHPHFSM